MALRHHFASLSLLALLAGCSSQPPAQQATDRTGDCNVDNLQDMLGQSISTELVEQIQRQANARSLRVLAPGDAATLDYNTQRLNIDIDESEVIIRLTCG